jgi:hypothetical protein
LKRQKCPVPLKNGKDFGRNNGCTKMMNSFESIWLKFSAYGTTTSVSYLSIGLFTGGMLSQAAQSSDVDGIDILVLC